MKKDKSPLDRISQAQLNEPENARGDVLQQSESRLRSIANLVPDLLWDSEPDGSTNWYNQRWLEYTGQRLEQAIGWGWVDVIHPDDREGSAKRYADAVEADKALQQEHRIRRHDGTYRWFMVNAVPIKDEQGKTFKIYGAATDIHDRKMAEQVLIENEGRQMFLLELSDLLRPMTDNKAILATAARLLVEHLGASQAVYLEIVGKDENAKVIVLGQYADGVPSFPEEISFADFNAGFPVDLLMAEKTLVVEDRANDGRLSTAVKTTWAEFKIAAAIATSFGRFGKMVAKFGVHNASPRQWTSAEIRLVEEVAERTWAALERVLLEQTLKQRELDEKIAELETEGQREVFRFTLHALEEERHRISESLHNGIGQLLYGIKLAMADMDPSMELEDFKKARTYAEALLKDAIIETRRISHELMPTTLEQFGLKSALDDVCHQLSNGLHFTCNFKGLSRRLEKYLELAVYRTAQELMTNVLKHAKADKCEVEIKATANQVSIVVTDNGQGISKTPGHKPGIGLASIRSNIKLLGGQVKIQSRIGKGTKVEVTIPFQKENRGRLDMNNMKT
jgi:PAS domain S-box-containing protein